MNYSAAFAVSRIPIDFKSDGCSGGAPDTIFGYDISDACRLHDFLGCTRCWPAGTLDQAWRHAADRQLGIEVRSYLPYVLDWIGWIYWWAVHRFGGDESFDSCGAESGDLCRHGQSQPLWMRALG